MIYECLESPKKTKDSTASHSSNSGSSTKSKSHSYRIEKTFNPVIDEDKFESHRRSIIKQKKSTSIIQRSLLSWILKIKVKNLLSLQRKSKTPLYQVFNNFVAALQGGLKEAFNEVKIRKNYPFEDYSSEFLVPDKDIFGKIPISVHDQTNKEFLGIFNEKSLIKIHKREIDGSSEIEDIFDKNIMMNLIPLHNKSIEFHEQLLKPASLSDFAEFSDMSFSKLEFVKGNLSFNVEKFELLGKNKEKLLEIYKEAQEKVDKKSIILMKMLDERDDLVAQIEYSKRKIEKLMVIISKSKKF
ncbi:unnamed protein product [Blepharisma stoltei]|uniref:Uncharacterized protein n=1 Tax=Blepharisma stoltei TaxID=1481888 RepID=A0AAU9K287_9CILI|nr:unnamed protein product [Blepharisma stoltei]